MTEPKLVLENYEGHKNKVVHYDEWEAFGFYKNLSTIWVIPTRGTCHTRVALSWKNIVGGFNQPLATYCIEGFEVGRAYNEAISRILSDPTLSKYPYILTLEEDNAPPWDGLINLYKAMHKYDYSAISGLYWVKGEDGPPQIWGDPKIWDNPDHPEKFAPQPPIKDAVQECNGIGMGFALFKTEMFRNPGFEYGRWFQTKAGITQDLYFCTNAKKLGYKFAVNTSVRVGHFDGEKFW